MFQIWASAHFSFGAAADVAFLLLFVTYNIAGHITVVTTIVNFDLPPVPALVLSIEEVYTNLLDSYPPSSMEGQSHAKKAAIPGFAPFFHK